jgi:hypothetical protein
VAAPESEGDCAIQSFQTSRLWGGKQKGKSVRSLRQDLLTHADDTRSPAATFRSLLEVTKVPSDKSHWVGVDNSVEAHIMALLSASSSNASHMTSIDDYAHSTTSALWSMCTSLDQ